MLGLQHIGGMKANKSILPVLKVRENNLPKDIDNKTFLLGIRKGWCASGKGKEKCEEFKGSVGW